MFKLFCYIIGFIFILFNTQVFAEDLENTPYLPKIDFTSYFLTVFVLLLILVVFAFIAVKLKNRGNLPKLNISLGGLIKTDRRIKVLEKFVLEPRKTLYIVSVNSKNWLLASSETNLEVISELDINEDDLEKDNDMKLEKKDKEISSKDSKGKIFKDYLSLPVLILFSFFALNLIFPISAFAQANTPNFLDLIDLTATVKLKELGTPLQLIIFTTFLTLLPFFFIMTTAFVRIVIVLGFLRQAIGTQQVPPNQVLLGVALFLTFYIMAPTWQEVNDKALTPFLDNKITQEVAFDRGVKPLRNFMLKHTRKQELAFFMRIAKLPQPKNPQDVPLHVLIPSFMVSELSTGFKMGFFLFLPFLVVDLVVANTLLALGMMMLSPVTISMPFKLLIFTLANGWFLILQALVVSFKL